MTDREKLIALVYEGKMKRIDICANNDDCSLCERDADGEYCCDAVVADHLIASGVVVREKGEWTADGLCSVCGCDIPVMEDNFCPNCGADMRKGENDAQKE